MHLSSRGFSHSFAKQRLNPSGTVVALLGIDATDARVRAVYNPLEDFMSVNRVARITFAVIGFSMAMISTSDARIRPRTSPHAGSFDSEEGISLYVGLGNQDYKIMDADYDGLDQLDDGGALLIGGSAGVAPGASLFIEIAASEHPTTLGDHIYGTAMAGGKFAPNSRNGNAWQPYGKLSVGAMFLEESDSRRHCNCDISYVGPAIGLAFGLDKFVSPSVALFGEIGITAGLLNTQFVEYDEYELADDIDVTSGRVQFGLRFRL